MQRLWHRSVILAVLLVFVGQLTALAAASTLTNIRFHGGRDHDRVVLDLDKMPEYKIKYDEKQHVLYVELKRTAAGGAFDETCQGGRITGAETGDYSGDLRVSISLADGIGYKVGKLANPPRIFIDGFADPMAGSSIENSNSETTDSQSSNDGAGKISLLGGKADGNSTSSNAAGSKGNLLKRYYATFNREDVAPGMTKITYKSRDAEGFLQAWFVEADPKQYKLWPALGNGVVPGKERVGEIADDLQAMAAINASYFNRNGEIIGIVKIEGQLAGTSYYSHSAMGIRDDGSTLFGVIGYTGVVTMGGATQYASGVNMERDANGMVIYNSLYGQSTGTAMNGKEYTVVNGRVTAVRTGNSPIPENGVVISVQGSSCPPFARVRVGDEAYVTSTIDSQWDEIPNIMGAGPRLLQNGEVELNMDDESLTADVTRGRAPRSAVGVTKNGHYLIGVVDGRRFGSRGCTLPEWAELFKKAGGWNAINLDGGGSSEIVLGGRILNSPSDGSERPVGSALILTER